MNIYRIRRDYCLKSSPKTCQVFKLRKAYEKALNLTRDRLLAIIFPLTEYLQAKTEPHSRA
jgi:hypothetical protein